MYQGGWAVEPVRIVEVDGEVICPLPQEIVDAWALRPGMTIEVEVQGRSLLLKPPRPEQPPAADPSR